MNELPPPSPDLGPDGTPQERPPASAGLIALGVLALLLGIAFIAVLGLFIVGEATKGMQGGGAQGMPPELQEKMLEIQNEPTLRLTQLVGVGINTLVGLALITASIGIFKRRPWGWKLSISALSVLFGWTLISIVLMTVIVNPRVEPLVEELMESEAFADAPDWVANVVKMQFGWGAMLIGLCCCLPFPAVLFVGLWTPGIRSQFFPLLEAGPPGLEAPPPIDEAPPPQP